MILRLDFSIPFLNLVIRVDKVKQLAIFRVSPVDFVYCGLCFFRSFHPVKLLLRSFARHSATKFATTVLNKCLPHAGFVKVA